MEIIAPMWASNSPQCGKLLLTCTVSRVLEGETTLHLHENAIIDSSSKKKMTMPFDFDLKFGFSISPPTIYFEKQEERVKYEFKAEADLQACR